MNSILQDLRAKFEKLSPAQHRLMTFYSASTAKSRPVTGQKLLALGLVEKIERIGHLGVRTTDYRVPVPIHMCYCDWCADKELAKRVGK